MSDFRPPKPNKAVIEFSEFLLPYYLKFVERLTFDFYAGPDQPVRFLKGKKVVIVVNHSDRQDPLLVVALAKYMKEEFYCVAAREVFDWSYGILGWLFQRFGCFSVNRGSADFKSIHTIQKILKQSSRKFLVFPEGEVTGDDHLIHDIGAALIHIFLKTQKEIADSHSSESIWILPIGISYKLETVLKPSVDKVLKKIERHLGIEPDSELEIKIRTSNAFNSLLNQLSKQYGLAIPTTPQQSEFVRLLARHILELVSEVATDHKTANEISSEQLLHNLRNDITKQVSLKESRSIDNQTARRFPELLKDLDRVERLLIVERVLAQPSSPIQICRIIDFLESEICGKMTAKGRQRATVFFGNPIEIQPYLPAYQSDKNAAVQSLSEAVKHGLQLALDNSHAISNKTIVRAESIKTEAPLVK
jgi:1-acyl-sn-glycerol-3-phosphate acyltransferase